MASTTIPSPPSSHPERHRLHELILEAQGGDLGAFEQIVRLTEKLARRIAFSVVGPNLVEDALQESYLLVFRKLVTLKNPDSFLSWFGRLVLHASYSVQRKHPSTQEFESDLPGGDNTESLVSQLTLRKALSQLEEKDRNVLLLREMMELNYDQIAQTLRVKVGTVRSRLHSARKHLAERLLQR